MFQFTILSTLRLSLGFEKSKELMSKNTQTWRIATVIGMNILFDILILWRVDFADDYYEPGLGDALILAEVIRDSQTKKKE